MGGGRPERNCDNQIYCLNTCQLISFVLIGMLPIFFFLQIFVVCGMNGEDIYWMCDCDAAISIKYITMSHVCFLIYTDFDNVKIVSIN